MANNQTNEEYVKKGYLKAYLANRGIKCCRIDEWERLCECIDDAKSADVRENVRGEWIDEKRWSYEYDGNEVTVVTWKCSKCGEETNIRSNFCPDCGADMRPRTEKIYVPKEDFEIE